MISKKASLLFFLLIFSSLSIYAQRFEDGYYIDLDGNRIETQIEKRNWSTWSNSSVLIKTANGSSERISIDQITEFGVDGVTKFIVREVQVDRSYDNLDKLGYDPLPNYESDRILLKVLIEGNYGLYLYLEDQLKKFYYSKEGGTITPLAYKRYYKSETESIIVENNKYLSQLRDINPCEEAIVLASSYTLESLKKNIEAFNACTGEAAEFESANNLKSEFRMSAFVGYNFSSFNVDRVTLNSDSDVSGGGVGFGANFGFTLPSVSNEFLINGQIAYGQFDFDGKLAVPLGFEDRDVEISYQELQLGAEGHYLLYTGQNQYFDFGVGLYYAFALGDYTYTESFTDLNYEDSSNPGGYFSLILGYSISRVNIHIYYAPTGGTLFDNYDLVDGTLSRNFSVRLGYQFF